MEPHDDGVDRTDGVDATPATASAVPAQPSAPSAVPSPRPAPPVRPMATTESVAAALQELSTVEHRPLAEHPDAFARVHSGLQQALSDIDDA